MNSALTNVNLREKLTLLSNEKTYHHIDLQLIHNQKVLEAVKADPTAYSYKTDLPDQILHKLVIVVNRKGTRRINSEVQEQRQVPSQQAHEPQRPVRDTHSK